MHKQLLAAVLLGIVAGYLEGCGITVELFVHEDARDQQHMDCRAPFSSAGSSATRCRPR